ncbi:LCP family protein, partial [Streptococcus suis]
VSEKPVAEVFNGVDTSNGTNILILGTDGRVGESSGETRTDTIMVLNVNNTDNKIKLVSFMRDTLVDIEGYEYKLNTAYTLGEQDNQQGAEE